MSSESGIRTDTASTDDISSRSSIRIHLPPPLLFNLVGPCPSADTFLYFDPAPGISSILAPPLPTAASLTLARVASPHSVNKLYQPLFLEGLKEYFQSRKRVVKLGDLIAVGIEESRVRFASDAKDEQDEFESVLASHTRIAHAHTLLPGCRLRLQLPRPWFISWSRLCLCLPSFRRRTRGRSISTTNWSLERSAATSIQR